LGRSAADGRPWIVREIERANGRVALHVRKERKSQADPHKVGHSTTVPRG
jgi:hypothetical protein